MLGRRGRPVVAAVSLSVLMACGGGDQAAVVEPVVPEASTSTTVPPFDAAALPPHPLADHADFDAIVRELFAIRDDAFRYLDVERLEAVYAAECPCREEANEIRDAIREGYRIIGDTTPIRHITVELAVERRGVFVLAGADFPRVDHLDRESDELVRGLEEEEPDVLLRLALGHDGERWLLVNIERVR